MEHFNAECKYMAAVSEVLQEFQNLEWEELEFDEVLNQNFIEF